MKITWKVASAFAVLSSALCGGCQSPQEPVSISSSVDAVALVDLPLPRVGKGIQISVRLAEADGASLELLQCTVSLSRFDGQRWDDVYTEFCALPAGVELRAYPVVDGVKTWLFPAPDVPAGKYAVQAGVRRAGRNELLSVRAQFELSDAQTR